LKQVPIAALIISARANIDSNYNALTNYRWALSRNPFKGVSRAQGARAMSALVHKMIAGRHSSINFLKSGWVPAMKKLGPLVQRGGGGRLAGGAAVNLSDYHDGQPRGDASPASDAWVASASIENDTGTEGDNQQSQNEALWKYGAPALQSAVDREQAQTLEYIQRKMDEDNARFNARP
jgi:hypothetical protein